MHQQNIIDRSSTFSPKQDSLLSPKWHFGQH